MSHGLDQQLASTTMDDLGVSLRDLQIFEQVAGGRRHRDVAADYGLERSSVSKIVKAVGDALKWETIEDLRTIRVRQKVLFEHLICELMTAWERSKQDKVTITEKDVFVEQGAGEADVSAGGRFSGCSGPAATADVPATERTVRRETQAGDPRYLQLTLELSRELRHLFGDEVEQRSLVRVAGISRAEAIRQRARESLKLADKLDGQVKRDG